MAFVGKMKKKNIGGGDDMQQLRLGKYEIGRTLGQGNLGKVKYAQDVQTQHSFALKIIDQSILDPHASDQIKREIGTLKLLKHPNVVRLHEVLVSKTNIYMVLEYVKGGKLFNTIEPSKAKLPESNARKLFQYVIGGKLFNTIEASKGKLPESNARKLFQQLIDGVSYCHDKGVFHRNLKLENVLVDAKGNIKISDVGLSALPLYVRDDGLLYTACGSPNYAAPEILSNRGYDGAALDTWSCGVILYVILTRYLPFEDRNIAVLYQKVRKGDVQIPKWIPPGAKSLLKRILDPNPKTRITMTGIKADEWFKQDYSPAKPNEEEEDIHIDDEVLSIQETPFDAINDP